MLNSGVLVLNRAFFPVHITSVRRAFCLLYAGLARAINSQYEMFDFQSWSELSIHTSEEAIGLVGRMIRVPRARGGKTTWENIVCSCIACNKRKGGELPEQKGMRLIRRPARPQWAPQFAFSPRTSIRQEWLPFLSLVDFTYWNLELEH